jgi:orotidine-5'-phosphate decarboxylase
VGPVDPNYRDLSIRVSTVTHTSEGVGQCVVPGIRLRMMKGDAKGVTEDEVVLKISLNHTLS